MGKLKLEPCFQLFKTIELGQIVKEQQFHRSTKNSRQSGTLFFTTLKRMGIVPKNIAISGKESTMGQELDICNKVYKIATYNMRRACILIKKYNVRKTPYIQIRLFTAKENEDLKQVASVNYILLELKELSQVMGDFMLAEKKKYLEELCFLMFFMFFNWKFIAQNYFFLAEVYISS